MTVMSLVAPPPPAGFKYGLLAYRSGIILPDSVYNSSSRGRAVFAPMFSSHRLDVGGAVIDSGVLGEGKDSGVLGEEKVVRLLPRLNLCSTVAVMQASVSFVCAPNARALGCRESHSINRDGMCLGLVPRPVCRLARRGTRHCLGARASRQCKRVLL